MSINSIGSKQPGRNEQCPCGSGLKYKHCHGDNLKQQECNYLANLHMLELILNEQIKRGLKCKHGIPTGEKCVECSKIITVLTTDLGDNNQ